jgi:hypothetical protein
MQRRLRERSREREARLLDLGALVYELHRQGKRAPELLQEKAAELSVIDEEVRELEAALDGDSAPEAAETHEADALDAELDGEPDADPDAELDSEPEEEAEEDDEHEAEHQDAPR